MTEEKNTRHKWSTLIVVSNTKTAFTFDTPLELDIDKHYEIALVNFNMDYSFPNICENTMFKYSKDNGNTWEQVIIPERIYAFKALSATIQSMIGGDAIKLEPNRQTQKSFMTIKPNYKVSFKEKNILANLLGFENKIYDSGMHESENIVNIMNFSSILIHLNIINGSYINGSRNPVIYSFLPNVSPGFKIVEKPHNLVYLPVTMNTISNLEVKITDQNNKSLNLRGEIVTVSFHLREA